MLCGRREKGRVSNSRVPPAPGATTRRRCSTAIARVKRLWENAGQRGGAPRWGDSVQGRRFIQHAVKRTAAACDALRPSRAGVVVLIYHRGRRRLRPRVGPAGTALCRADGMAVRARQRRESRRSGPHPFRTAGAVHSDTHVVLTFDDGTADFVDQAFPILDSLGLPATLYVATGFIEEAPSVPRRSRPRVLGRRSPTCSGSGLTVGSHTHAHALLDRVSRRGGCGRTRPLVRPDRGAPRRRGRPLRVPEGDRRLARGRAARASAIHLRGGRRNAAQPVRARPTCIAWRDRRSSTATA